MPSLANYQLTPPTDSREFEQIMREYCSAKYQGSSFLFARKGQRQYGVDVINCCSNRIIAIQCKDYQDTKVNIKMVDTWIERAAEFSPPINHLVIAIADKSDGEIQKHVMEVSQQRLKSGLFGVEVMYWEEISAFIKHRSEMLKMYYPFIMSPQGQQIANQVLIENAYELKKCFVELYVKYNIQDFISSDAFVGIDTDNLIEANIFDIELEHLLRRAVMLRETDECSDICDFVNNWNQYRVYLVPYVHPHVDGKYVKINSCYMNDMETMNLVMTKYKDLMNKAYERIIV